MVDKIQRIGQKGRVDASNRVKQGCKAQQTGFDKLLQQKAQEKSGAAQPINFSKHALARAEERGIELTPTLMDKLAGSVEKAQEKGANTILAFDSSQAFIINIPYGRVITAMSQEEMRENIFTNIDGAVLL